MNEKEKDCCTLQSFFESIALRDDSTAHFHYKNRFKYVHDVIALSRVPNAVTIILWFLIFVAFDLTICGQAIPFSFYSSLYPDDFLQNPSTEDFIFSELGIQQAAFVLIVLVMAILLFQWISLIVYNGKLHLSVFVASMLNVTFFQLPHLLSVVSGILFGALSLATSGDRLTKHTSLFYCLILAGMTLLLQLNVYVFTGTCEYNLVLRNSFFSHFEIPFGVIDLMFMFTMDFFLALRVGLYEQYMVIGSSLCIFWGVMTLVFSRRTVFLTFWPNVMLSKLPVDAIVFGFMTILDILIKIPNMLLLDLWVVMYLVDIGIAYFILGMNLRFTRNRFEPHGGHCFNQAKFVKKQHALAALRLGVSYGWKEAVDPDFVKWVFSSFYHDSMMPDIVRICLVTKIPLADLPWHQVVSPKHLTALKFLSFQTDLYMKFLATDGDEKLDAAVKLLSDNSAELEAIGQNFWTESDLDHKSIMDLGRAIRGATRTIRNEASCYPKVIKILEIWHNFCSAVLCAPSEYSRAFTNIYWVLNQPFSFALPECEHKTKGLEKKPTSSIERYVSDFTRKASLPFHICLRLCTLMFFLIVISYNTNYVNQMKRFSNVFTNVSQLYILSASLGYRLLYNTDRFTELPSLDQIMATLNLDAQTATDFRGNFELKSPEMTNASRYISLLEDTSPSPKVPGCNPMSLSLMTVFELRDFSSTSEVKCYKDIILQYIDTISEYADGQTNDVIHEFNVKLQDDRAVEIALTVIMTVAFVVCLVILKSRQVKALDVLRKITSFNQHRFELREPGMAFSLILLLVLWVAFMSSHLLMFEVLVQRTTETAELMQQKLVQTDLISDIARNGMSLMALVEYGLLSDEMYQEVQSEVTSRAVLLLNSTHYVTKSGILDSFEDVFPLNCWSTPSAESFSVLLMDFGHLLLRGEVSETNYQFLTARYWVVFNISLLANQTLEEMMATSLLSLQQRSATFWLASIGFLLAGIFIWLLLEWIHSLHKLWFNGVQFLLRREMNKSADRMRRLLELMTSDEGSMLERLPVAAIVSNGRVVVDCNEKAASFMGHSVEQAVGQKLSEFFPDTDEFESCDGKRLKLHTCQMANNLEIVRIQDMTAKYQCDERRRSFLEAMKCDLPLPFKNNVIVISIRLMLDATNAADVLSVLSEAEDCFSAVKRILCCCHLYRAVVLDKDYDSAALFAAQVMNKLSTVASLVITEGVVIVTSLFDDGIATSATGLPVEQADKCLIDAPLGACTVDPAIADHFPF